MTRSTPFIRKMEIWKSRLGDGITDMFPLITDFMDKEELTLDVVSDQQICGHLTALISHFNKYFDDIKVDDYDWMRNPFAARALSSSKNLCAKAEEELAELSSDRTLAIKFQETLCWNSGPPSNLNIPSSSK